MFTIISGLPGAGKTLHTINNHLKYTGKRPVFFYNIPLTEEGQKKLSWIELERDQVFNWYDEIPPDGILIVDEAQILWPLRPSSKPVPQSLKEIETHRHKGIDLVFITQDPSLLDSHARKLANEHYHYIRPFGANYSIEHHSGSGVVSVTSQSDLSRTIKKRVMQPKGVYPLYKSAEAHTHKFRPPKILLLIPIFIIIVVYAIYSVKHKLNPNEESLRHPGAVSQSSNSHPGTLVSGRDSMSWKKLLKPEIKGLPYTAPLYHDKAIQVTEVPRVAGCATFNNVCHCYTQQGTKISGVSQSNCKNWITNRPFDHLVYQNRNNGRGDSSGGQGRHDSARRAAHRPITWDLL